MNVVSEKPNADLNISEQDHQSWSVDYATQILRHVITVILMPLVVIGRRLHHHRQALSVHSKRISFAPRRQILFLYLIIGKVQYGRFSSYVT